MLTEEVREFAEKFAGDRPKRGTMPTEKTASDDDDDDEESETGDNDNKTRQRRPKVYFPLVSFHGD